MKRKISTLLLSFACTFCFAQNAKIEGRVTDEKGEGLIQANVIIDAAKGWATVSDFDGNYELSVPAGSYEVTYRYVGKEEQRFKITLTDGQKLKKDLVMTERARVMDQVVVSGSKYAKKLSEETVTMEVMNNKVLSNQNVTDVQNGVQKIPGVTIADGQANIRGGSGWSYGAGSRVAVLYDGLPITTADADDAKWSMLPVENIEQIEVLKGAASAIYGSGALNGVINSLSAYPTDKPYTKVLTYAGFYDAPKNRAFQWWSGKPQYMVGANFADRRKVGQWDLVTGLAYNNDKSWQSGTPYSKTDSTSKNFESAGGQDARANFRIRYRFKKIEGLNVGVNTLLYWSWGTTFFLWDSIGKKGYTPLPGTVTKYENGRYMIDPYLNYTDKHNNNISFKYRWLNSSNINSTGQGSLADRHILDLSYQRPFDISEKVKLKFIAGVGARLDRVKPPTNANDTTSAGTRQHITDSLGYYPTPYLYGNKPHYANNASVYAQLDAKFFNRLSVILGARWEYFNVDGQNSLKDLTYPLFRLGLNYQAADATYIRASFGQGFRYPSIAEFFVTTSVGPISIYPNEKLKPEKGFSAELGIKQGFKFGKKAVTTGYVDLSGYLNQYQNMMEFMFGAFGDPLTRPTFGAGFSSQNVGDTRIIGFDATVGIQTTVKDFTLSFLAGYTFINTRSLNWDKPLTLYDETGQLITPSSAFGILKSAYNNKNAPKNIDTLTQITYGMTSSSSSNVLKYRPTHQMKIVFNLEHKRWDFNLDYQFIAFQQNIDYAFTSPIFRGLSTAFEGLYQYRTAQISDNYAGDHILNMGIGFKPVEKLKIAFIVKNVLNWEWMPRPGRFEAPRNYTLQLSYQF